MNSPELPLPPGVIKVKLGYNPNSSSIGTAVYSIHYLLAVVSGALALLAALVRGKKRKEK